MFHRLEPSVLFEEHLDWIDKVAAITCRRNSVWGDEAEDFASWAKMRLIEDDYAVLKKHRGECELKTYLTIVIVRLFQEYARERWGRWRNSAAAERQGQLAKELETLVHRDGYMLAQAGEKLRSSGRTTASDAELARVLARLPARAPLRPRTVGAEPLDRLSATAQADDPVVCSEHDERRRAVLGAMTCAMERLEPEDRAILRMNFADGYSVADVARALGLEQKALYRRVERLRLQVRGYLQEAGISADVVRELVYQEEK